MKKEFTLWITLLFIFTILGIFDYHFLLVCLFLMIIKLKKYTKGFTKVAEIQDVEEYCNDQKYSTNIYCSRQKADADAYFSQQKNSADAYFSQQKDSADKYLFYQKSYADSYFSEKKASADRYYDEKINSVKKELSNI